jgi:NAD(P)-dependent dehydrogenase (short-subunit alcohol dehydrogenase family)
VPTQQEAFGGGTAVITGAGSGIGEGLAHHLAGALDMLVVLTDVNEAGVRRVAEDVVRADGRAEWHVVDVRDADAMAELADRVHAEHGAVRLLVNNAGVEQFGYLWDVSPENWRRIVDINISGVFHGIRAFLPRMIADEQRSHVLTMASIGAVTTVPMQAPYIMSKHALLALTECLYQELLTVGANVAVGAVMPAMVASGIFDAARGVDGGDVAAVERHRATMRDAMSHAITPAEAAETIMEQAAAEEFFIVTQPDIVRRAMVERADRLVARTPPPPFRSRFEQHNDTTEATVG